MPKIAIVDEHDEIIGSAERKEALAAGLRHRVVRIFLYNREGQVLLQQRAAKVYDNAGKWDQSAGGHVDEDEAYEVAAKREAKEELGISLPELEGVGAFYIERPSKNGLIRRFQKIYIAPWNEAVTADPTEVSATRWFNLAEIDNWLATEPNNFTVNFHRAYAAARSAIESRLH